MNFYKTKKWKNKRAVILRRDEYECRHCKRYGNTTLANTVHHVYPLEYYPQHKLNSKNLISLCGECHSKMHNRITNELTAEGLAWCERIGNLDEE